MSSRPTRPSVPVTSSAPVRRPAAASTKSASVQPAASAASTSAPKKSIATKSSDAQNPDFTPMAIPVRAAPSAPAPSSSHSSSSASAHSSSSSASSHSTREVSQQVAQPSSSKSSSSSTHGLRHSDDDADEIDTNGEGVSTRRVNMQSVMAQAKADMAEIAREHGGVASKQSSSASDYVNTNEEFLPPSLPPQLDEDNDLYYCPRLTVDSLQRITGETNLSKVHHLSLHLNTEEQDLNTLNILLPNLKELRLIPPSSVTSFRDFGRSLASIVRLSIPSVSLADLDGIECLKQLSVLNASHNHIDDLSPLMYASISSLTGLDLSYNRVKEMDMIEFIGVCTQLKQLELEGNPISNHVHYRAIVGSRCADIPEGQLYLDDRVITSDERLKRGEKEEAMVDKKKLTAQREKSDARPSSGTFKHSSDAFTSLAASRPSGKSDSRSESPTLNGVAVHAAASSSNSSTYDPTLAAARKKEYQRFLQQKESPSNNLTSSGADTNERKARKKAMEEELIRAENDDIGSMKDEKRSDRVNSNSRSNVPTIAAIPRLEFDTAHAANTSVIKSPSSTSSSATGPIIQPQLSLSTPRPGTASGGARPGTSSGARPGTSSGARPGSSAGGRPVTQDPAVEAEREGASDLTYGSDTTMAGNYAQAMRARKKQNSISISHSGGVGGREASVTSKGSNEGGGGGERDSHSPSRSASPYSLERQGSASRTEREVMKPSSASRERASPAHSVSSSPPSTATSSHHPSIVFKVKPRGGGVDGSTAAMPSPVLPSSGGAINSGLQPSRPIVMVSSSTNGSGTNMMQRHATGMPISPNAATRASAPATEEVYTINRSAPSKAYTIVRQAAPK